MIDVLEASAMIVFLNDETGAAVIESHLLDADSVCYSHAINLCEVYLCEVYL